MLHEKWDAEERKAVEGPIGPIHYENVRFDGNKHVSLFFTQLFINGVTLFMDQSEKDKKDSLQDQGGKERQKL